MNEPAAVPVFTQHAAGEPIFWRRGAALDVAHITARVLGLARVLPAVRFAINLCESRANFLIGLLAAAQRAQVTLLPSSRAPLAVGEIGAAYPDHCVVNDERVEAALPEVEPPRWPITIALARPLAIAFTSGSTGRPEGHAKDWGTLIATARLARDRFLPHGRRHHVVATVPPQHMYGLEASITLVLVSGSAVSDARPFFPADIAAELAALPEPRVLVTTPAHLRACVAAGTDLPPLALVISATATLERDLAAAAERAWQTRVCEIYGCTEAGSMATRRTVESDSWRAHSGAWIEQREAGPVYRGAHLPEPVPLPDVLELTSPSEFRLLGRSADLVKVAGKRASLAELTRRLLGVAGVLDGIVFVPAPDARPAAVVVAPGVSREEILAALAAQVDSAFLPRPLVIVDALPRTESGKLPRASLLAAIGVAHE